MVTIKDLHKQFSNIKSNILRKKLDINTLRKNSKYEEIKKAIFPNNGVIVSAYMGYWQDSSRALKFTHCTVYHYSS